MNDGMDIIIPAACLTFLISFTVMITSLSDPKHMQRSQVGKLRGRSTQKPKYRRTLLYLFLRLPCDRVPLSIESSKTDNITNKTEYFRKIHLLPTGEQVILFGIALQKKIRSLDA